MCSIGEDDFGDEGGAHSMPVTQELSSEVPEGTCRKCGSPAVVKLNFKDPQCKDCFLYYVRHKFRANLGSSKILPRTCSVLTVFDGSAGSVCLLDLVINALQLDNHKRLSFDHHIIFLDDSFLYQVDCPMRRKEINEIIQQFPEKFLYLSMAEDGRIPEEFCSATDTISEDQAAKEKQFIELREKFSNQTAWEDFLAQRKRNLILRVAKHLACNHIFLSDITIDLASSLLSNVSLGRGASVALDVGFIDDRDQEVKFLRPIRDLTLQEVENYVRVNDFRFLEAPRRDPQSSIQNLTKKFVADLQQNFSSTVSTVFRTGDKLTAKRQDDKCEFCQSSIDWKGSKTLSAVEFSKEISSGVTGISAEAAKHCYACQRILSDCPGITEYFIK